MGSQFPDNGESVSFLSRDQGGLFELQSCEVDDACGVVAERQCLELNEVRTEEMSKSKQTASFEAMLRTQKGISRTTASKVSSPQAHANALTPYPCSFRVDVIMSYDATRCSVMAAPAPR